MTVAGGYGFPTGGIFNAALDAVIVMDHGGLVRDWNPAAERAFGYSRDEAIGREVAELIMPGQLRDAHRNALARYIRTREPTLLDRRIEVSGLRRNGAEFPVELTITRIPDTEPPLFVGFIRDLGELDATKRENTKLQQRMAFLAQAGLVLESSLDVDETLHGLAQLTVPEIAELAVIDLLEDDRSIRLTVAAAAEPAIAHRLEELRRREPLQLTSVHPVARVLRTAAPVVIETMSPQFHERIAQGPEHLELMREFRYRSAIVVPLIARQRVLGALSILRIDNPDPYDRDDLVLMEELARRAGLAVANARLFMSTRHLARTLQESLLPQSMPEIPGVRLVGHYRAAEQGQEVGGDFYDVFPVGPRHWGIAIGDVCGKGPEAAALTALARYTIRALASRDPATVLRLLNDAVLRDPGLVPDRFLTVLFGIATWEPEGLALELVAAGHPPPLVRRADGRVEQVGAGGVLIGVATEVEYRSERTVLEPGDSILFYTDGLTDARAPAKILTESDIAQMLSAQPRLEGGALAQFLEDSVTGGQDPRDDIALLILELEPGYESGNAPDTRDASISVAH